MARETIDILNADALRETLEAIREFIKEHRSFKAPGLEPPSIPNDSVVRVTGQPILATTTTTPAPTSTSSTTSTTSTTTPGPTYLWPGKYLIRDFSTTVPSEKWQEIADIYIEEVNGFELEIGKNYPAEYIGQYGGLAVFGVEATGEESEAAGSGSGPCAGVRISDLIRCTDDGLEIRDGCLTIIDGQVVLIPDDSVFDPPEEPTIIIQPSGGTGPVGPTISWQEKTAAVGYVIEHSTDGAEFADEEVTDLTEYDSSAFALDGATHYWRVKAVYENGVSGPSNEVFAQGRTTSGDLTWPLAARTGLIELYGQGGDGAAGGGGGGGAYSAKDAGIFPVGEVAITVTAGVSYSGDGMTANAGADADGSNPGTGGTASGGDTNTSGSDGLEILGGDGGGPAGGAGGNGEDANGSPYGGGGGSGTGLGAAGAAIITGTR